MEGVSREVSGLGKNPSNGALIDYSFAKAPDTLQVAVKLEIFDANDKVLRTITTKKRESGASARAKARARTKRDSPLFMRRGRARLCRHKNPCFPRRIV